MRRSCAFPPFVALAVVTLMTTACMRFAPNYPTTHLASNRPDLPVPTGYEYRKTASPATLEHQSISADGQYETYALTLPSVGDDGQRQLLVTAQYLKAKTPGKKKLVIVVPIYGSITFASKMMARQLVEWQKQDTNVLLIQDANEIFDPDIERAPIVNTEAELLQGECDPPCVLPSAHHTSAAVPTRLVGRPRRSLRAAAPSDSPRGVRKWRSC